MSAEPIPSSVVVHPAKADLLAKIQRLESSIARLEEEKAACQYQIDQYYRLFRLHLGDLLTQTVDLQLKLALQRARQTGRRSDAEEAQTWQDRFEETNRAVQEAIAHKPTELDETAEQDLRRLYRKAVSLAHPDRHVNDPDRMAQATAYMTRLNDAYQRRDLTLVRQLVQDLNNGLLFMPSSETTQTLEALQGVYQRLLDRQTTLQADINQLKANDAYQQLTSQADLMAHFTGLGEQMKQQIHHLQQQVQSS
ncbi:J domain-containing protein [Spirosoma radiotolerans]|uniref:Molecular chaperone DnaJ n=1 Tax=Spirosoma radiotolerans TaxID=1379870 RepID=A0A0E3V7Q9_9BACT|nr:J domain-containing protein [Spirosoma radiotolerans]AKD56082.1 hypothetical protein SD10_15445 [Spirosoma radiotolerans]